MHTIAVHMIKSWVEFLWSAGCNSQQPREESSLCNTTRREKTTLSPSLLKTTPFQQDFAKKKFVPLGYSCDKEERGKACMTFLILGKMPLVRNEIQLGMDNA